MIHDSKTRYGHVTRLFHWIMALFIAWPMLKFFDLIDDGEHWVGQTQVPWHISVGTLLPLLILARIVWTTRHRVRPATEPAIALLLKASHICIAPIHHFLRKDGTLRRMI